MKALKCIVVIACVMLFATGALAYPDNPLATEQTWYAPQAGTPPVLDGDLSDWQGALSFVVSPTEIRRIGDTYGWLDEATENAISAGNILSDHTGEEGAEARTDADCAATLYLMYDSDNVYFAGEVIDNVYDVEGDEVDDPSAGPSHWWTRDGICIFFDVPDDGDGPEWIPGDHAFAFCAVDQATADWTVWWRHGEAEGQVEAPTMEATYGFQLTAEGYIIEGAFPFELLTLFTPEVDLKPGVTVGMCLLVLDPDGGVGFGGQLNYAMGGSTGAGGDDDRYWGELVFSDQIIDNAAAVESSTWGQIKSSF